MSLMNAFIEYHIVDITFVNTILSSKLSATPLEAFKGGYFFYRDYLWRVLVIFPFSGTIKIFTVKENHSVQRLARYFVTDRHIPCYLIRNFKIRFLFFRSRNVFLENETLKALKVLKG